MRERLEYACRELDELLMQCLLTWSDAADRHRETPQYLHAHAQYMSVSSHLLRARAALTSASQTLVSGTVTTNTVSEDTSLTPSAAGPAPMPVQVHVTCHCVPGNGSGHCRNCSDITSGRPGRPERSDRSCGRGTGRDWNRTVFGEGAAPASSDGLCPPQDGGRGRTGTGGSSRFPAEASDIIDEVVTETDVVEDDEVVDLQTGKTDKRRIETHQKTDSVQKEARSGPKSKARRSKSRD
ncbi:hypothetical protein E1180_09120 [Roseibium denhamense]|uniref:Uncharacterized protein n=1 Tax=Roseibium denhamense TaxID=76305 RepID=A0ABY1N9I2_9HYPH|nr:hypothetical protein [Roseibium denhamense]MTI05677.1 hypothetical protein [Roseibium denhamense]SMP04122.1 hypothetical protein SAMN06265374_0587 [Roseibium denhamense]